MNEVSLKGILSDEDYMIKALNYCPKEYGIILDGFKNCLTTSGNITLTIEVILEKMNHRYKKLDENELKRKKKKH